MTKNKKLMAVKRVGTVASFCLAASLSMNTQGAMDKGTLDFLQANSDRETVMQGNDGASTLEMTRSLVACTNYYGNSSYYGNTSYYSYNPNTGVKDLHTQNNTHARDNYYGQSNT